MKLGNIIINKQTLALDKSIQDNFIISESIDNVDTSLPTLIIGYDVVNNKFPDFDIGNILIKDKVYWTFKKTEKRDRFNEDLNWFITKVFTDMTVNIDYLFIDPIQYNTKTMFKILRKIFSLKQIITYKQDNMCYLFDENIIFGVDLKLLEFIGFDKNKIENKIKKHSYVFIEKDDEINNYKETIKYLDNKIRYIPLLHHIKHN